MDGLGRLVTVNEQDSSGYLTQASSYTYNCMDLLTLNHREAAERVVAKENLQVGAHVKAEARKELRNIEAALLVRVKDRTRTLENEATSVLTIRQRGFVLLCRLCSSRECKPSWCLNPYAQAAPVQFECHSLIRAYALQSCV